MSNDDNWVDVSFWFAWAMWAYYIFIIFFALLFMTQQASNGNLDWLAFFVATQVGLLTAAITRRLHYRKWK